MYNKIINTFLIDLVHTITTVYSCKRDESHDQKKQAEMKVIIENAIRESKSACMLRIAERTRGLG